MNRKEKRDVRKKVRAEMVKKAGGKTEWLKLPEEKKKEWKMIANMGFGHSIEKRFSARDDNLEEKIRQVSKDVRNESREKKQRKQRIKGVESQKDKEIRNVREPSPVQSRIGTKRKKELEKKYEIVKSLYRFWRREVRHYLTIRESLKKKGQKETVDKEKARERAVFWMEEKRKEKKRIWQEIKVNELMET